MGPTTRRQWKVYGCSLGDDGQAYETMEGQLTQENILNDMELNVLVHALIKCISNQAEKSVNDQDLKGKSTEEKPGEN